MSTEAATKVAPVNPPAAPVAPAKPTTPPIPKAQAESSPKPSQPKPLATTTPKDTPRPPESLGDGLKKVSEQVWKKAEAPADPKPTEAKAADPKPVEAKATDPKAPEAPADPFSDIAMPEGMSEKSATGWKALKAKAASEVSAARMELQIAQAQLETLKKATPADLADITKLKADHQAALDKLAILDLSSHPDFHKQFVAPRKKALEDAQLALADNAIEGAPSMASLLEKPRGEFAKAVSELAAKLPAYDQATFAASMREAYRLQGEEKGALSQAGELQKNLAAKMAQQQRNAFDATWGEVESRLKPLAVPETSTAEERAEIAEYNQAMANIRTDAERNAFGKLDEKGVAQMAAKASTLDFVAHRVVPRMQREMDRATTLIADLTSELTAIKSRKNPGTFSGADASGGEQAAPASLKDLSKQVFGPERRQ